MGNALSQLFFAKNENHYVRCPIKTQKVVSKNIHIGRIVKACESTILVCGHKP
jgi:hypothetical protein